ncbi:MAG TPA: M24 family metallopeptidase [Puia sp.]|nr:M24 family metallopeptidase [Puia sp.]
MNEINTMSEAKQKLRLAEQKAKKLFKAVEDKGLIVPGKSEQELSEEIVSLANDDFGITRYWHKKIVRAGANTLHPYNGNPPDRIIQKDAILFLDFGPVVEGWEADLGRTYVIGNNPLKLKLKRDIEAAWQEAKTWYMQQAALTGAACFNYVTELAKRYGWEFGGEIGGHIVGPFPHEQLGEGNLGLDIHPDNHDDILQPDKDGNRRHWILELQFVDRVNQIGAFFEQLLD